LTSGGAGTDTLPRRFLGMAERNTNQPAPKVSAQDARQGQPQGFVRYVMYTSIAAALIGMFIAYLVISS
jgi:hypothetical protein